MSSIKQLVKSLVERIVTSYHKLVANRYRNMHQYLRSNRSSRKDNMGKLTVVDVICKSLENEPEAWCRGKREIAHKDGFRVGIELTWGGLLMEGYDLFEGLRIWRAYKRWKRNPRSDVNLIRMYESTPELSYDALLEEVKYLASVNPEHALISKHAYIRNLVK